MAQSLTRIHFQVFLILLLCFAASGYAGLLALRDMQQASYHERASQVAGDTSRRINELVAQQRAALEKIARQPGAAALLQRGTPPERSRRQEEIKSQLTGATSVHLLPRNSLGAFSATEGLDPACLDYVRRMASTNAPAVPEFHSVDSPAGHYDLAVPVADENHNPVGYLLAGFTRAPLQAILEQSRPENTYMELQQPTAEGATQTVLTAGKISSAKATVVTSTLGSGRWTLIYQSAQLPPPILSGNRVDILNNGQMIFPAMLDAIGQAKSSINLESYIFWSDGVGSLFAEALSERARAGVQVRVLLEITLPVLTQNLPDLARRHAALLQQLRTSRQARLHQARHALPERRRDRARTMKRLGATALDEFAGTDRYAAGILAARHHLAFLE